jgi:hypothetical protein
MRYSQHVNQNNPTMITTAQMHRTWEIAQQYGGGFVSALAQAWFRGDQRNKERIEQAFPHLIEEYGPGSSFYS